MPTTRIWKHKSEINIELITKRITTYESRTKTSGRKLLWTIENDGGFDDKIMEWNR